MYKKPAYLKILKEYGWNTEKEIEDFIVSVPEEKVKAVFNLSKAFMIRKIDRLLLSVDRTEEMVQGTRDMVAPGAILEPSGPPLE